MAGTAEDARLLVQLAQWGAMMGLTDAFAIVFDEQFDPETATTNDEGVRIVVYFAETVGTLVKNDLLNRELLLDWLSVASAWERVGPAALRAREEYGVPQLYENFEALAKAQAG
jgi:hypothetical protein